MILQGLKPRIFNKLNKFGRKWIQELPSVIWSLRTTPSRATGHGLHPVLPRLWRRGHPPHGLGVRVLEAQGLPRGTKPASSRRLAGPCGRGSRRGDPALSKIPAIPSTISSTEGSTSRPRQGRSGAEAVTRQPGSTQALAAVGRAVHHRRSTQARHVQAREREGRNLRQCLEHSTATSLLPMNLQVFSFILLSFTQL